MSNAVSTPVSKSPRPPSRQTKPLSEVLRTLAKLAPEGVALEEALLLLGFRLEVESLGQADDVEVLKELRPDSMSRNINHLRESAGLDEPSKVLKRHYRPSMLEREDAGGSAGPPDWLGDAVLLVLPDVYRPAYRLKPPSLFNPRRERALILAMISKLTRAREIDIDRAVLSLARLDFDRRLPSRLKRSIRSGAVVVLDIGPSMEPFHFDLQFFCQAFLSVVGGCGTEVRYTNGSPLQGVLDPQVGATGQWRWPLPGTPILLVTDLGIGRSPDVFRAPQTNSWIAFASAAMQAGNPLRVLAPYSPTRFPGSIRSKIPIVEWDRETGVRAAVG